MAGTDATGHLANITAYSYDADNRALDTVTGAQTMDASSTSAAGVPDSNGLTNTRTRQVYDPDGNVVAALPPQAFSGSGSPATLAVNVDTAARTDFDLDGRAVTSYDPRYDAAAAADTGAGNDGGTTGNNQQTSQCRTGATPNLAPGIGKYGATIGVCTATISYDSNGNAVKQTLATSNGQDNRYLARTYTDDDLVLTETMPDPSQDTSTARVTDHTYRYDGVDRPIKDTDANGTSQTTAYTDDGLVAQTDDQCYNIGGGTRDTTKDCTWTGGTTITHRVLKTYDADGNMTSQTQPRAQSPGQASVGLLTAADLTTTTTWTTDGLQDSVRAPGLAHDDFEVTSYGYDRVGNKINVAMPSANAGTADANNPDRLKTQYQFTDDNLIKLSSTPVATGSFRNVVYNYNPAGQKVSTYVCTTSSRTSCPDSTSGSDGRGLTRYTYAPNGLNIAQVAKATTATPTTITTGYDQAGRVKSIKDSSSQTTIKSAYYLDGLLRTADDGTNANTYAYDGDSHLTNRTDKTDSTGPTGGAVKRTSYSYGNAGLLTKMISDVHTGKTTTVGYDPGGRMTTWTDAGGGTGQTRTYSYLPDDRLASVNTRASGDTSDRLDYAYTYDNDGNIISQAATGTANSNYTNTYTYNAAANIASYVHTRAGSDKTSSSSTSYTWDHNANRLTAATTTTDPGSGANSSYNQTWQYQADNSIVKQSITATGAAGVTQNYSYDQAGLLRSIVPAGSSTACTTNSFDDLDRVKTVVNTAGTACPGVKTSTTTYTYDGVDRQRTATTAGSSTVAKTIYDGLSKTTTGQSKTLSGDDSKPDTLYQITPDGHHVAMWQASSTTSAASLLDDDSYGNTSLLINSSKTGASATGCTVNYDPFGNPTAASSAVAQGNGVCSDGSDASSTGNTDWYRDQRRDGNTGDYQLGSRTYDPTNANFSAPDNYRVSDSDTDLAVGTDPLTANTYNYVNGNPLNTDDPNGHCPVDVCGAGAPKGGSQGAAAPVSRVTKKNRGYGGGNWDGSSNIKVTEHVSVDPDNPNAGDIVAGISAEIGRSNGALLAPDAPTRSMNEAHIWQNYCGTDGAKYCGGETLQLFFTINHGYAAASRWVAETQGKHRMPTLGQINLAYNSRNASDSLPNQNVFIGIGTGIAADIPGALTILGRPSGGSRAGPQINPSSDIDSQYEELARDRVFCGGQSFSPETKVIMADGTTRQIRDVKAGDKVKAFDSATERVQVRTITAIWVNHDNDLLNVKIKTRDGVETIHTTQRHLFFVPSLKRWIYAGSLKVGTILQAGAGRYSAAIVSVRKLRGSDYMWDRTVETYHNFFVSAGDSSGVLVHNCPSGESEPARSSMASLSSKEQDEVQNAIDRAANGKIRFQNHDGEPYDNRDGALPPGNYTEWTAAPNGAKRGAHRVIIEGDPSDPDNIYYWDHINPPTRIGP